MGTGFLSEPTQSRKTTSGFGPQLGTVCTQLRNVLWYWPIRNRKCSRCSGDLGSAYENGPLGQTQDDDGIYYYGTRIAIGVSATAVSAAVFVGSIEFFALGNQSVVVEGVLGELAQVVVDFFSLGQSDIVQLLDLIITQSSQEDRAFRTSTHHR